MKRINVYNIFLGGHTLMLSMKRCGVLLTIGPFILVFVSATLTMSLILSHHMFILFDWWRAHMYFLSPCMLE